MARRLTRNSVAGLLLLFSDSGLAGVITNLTSVAAFEHFVDKHERIEWMKFSRLLVLPRSV